MWQDVSLDPIGPRVAPRGCQRLLLCGAAVHLAMVHQQLLSQEALHVHVAFCGQVRECGRHQQCSLQHSYVDCCSSKHVAMAAHRVQPAGMQEVRITVRAPCSFCLYCVTYLCAIVQYTLLIGLCCTCCAALQGCAALSLVADAHVPAAVHQNMRLPLCRL